LEGLRALQSSGEQALLALRAHADAMREISARSASISGRTDHALRQIREASGTIADLERRCGLASGRRWDEPPPEIPPAAVREVGGAGVPELHANSALGTSWAAAARNWRLACDEVRRERQAWRSLVDEQRRCERRCAVALESTRIGRILSSVAASSPSLAAPARYRAMLEALTPERPWESPLTERIIAGGLTPDETAAAWQELADSGADLDQIVERNCVALAGLDGIPFSVQDRAARHALDLALRSDEQLELVFEGFGFSDDELSILDFRRELESLSDQLAAADREHSTAQLVGLGRHDGAVVAGISFGDLDRARTVAVLIPGMNSDIHQLDDPYDAFARLRSEQAAQASDTALVSWSGYRAPGMLEELSMTRAHRGARELADFLDSVSRSRSGISVERLVVIGHSYGSTTAAEALKLVDRPVSAFVTLGSAGLAVGTAREDLAATEVYATHANGDNIAQVGQLVHVRHRSDGFGIYQPRVDPRALTDVHEFSSEESGGGQAVTMHNLKTPIEWGALQPLAALDGRAAHDEVGYLAPESSTVVRLGEIIRGPVR